MGLALGLGVGVSVGVAVGVGVGVDVAVGVGLGVGDAATTVKFTVIEAPLVPVPPVELHGVAAKVWFPNAGWRQREIKRRRRICLYGAAISSEYHASRVARLPAPLPCSLFQRIRFVPLTNGVPPL